VPSRAVTTRSPLSRRGRAKPHGALARQAADLEARSEAEETSVEETIKSLSDRGWIAVMRWACEAAEGLAGPDGTRPTNLDRYNAATFLAKLRGEYAPAKLAVKAEEERSVVVAFRGFSVPVEDDAPALPHVAAPDGAYADRPAGE
jgi:hypothetical protein